MSRDQSRVPRAVDGNDDRTFKERISFAVRKDEVTNIRSKFPTKIPVIVERYRKEQTLPTLDKTKFLVPQELTVSQFMTVIRNRMEVLPTQDFYLIVNNKSMASLTRTIAEVHREARDEDGFLYMTYASQDSLCHMSRIPRPVDLNANGTFEERKSLAARKEDVGRIRSKFPSKIPVLVEVQKNKSADP